MRVASFALVGIIGVLSGASADVSVVDKSRPVSKVITLLKDMVQQLDKEAEEDEDTYETMGCWCETNDKEKTKAIGDGEARVASLGTTIEELTGKSARLNQELSSLNSELGKNQGALDTATALREKQLAEFNEEEKSMLASIGSLKAAVETLEKHHSGAAFLGVPDEEAMNIIATVRDQLRVHADLLKTVITPMQKRLLDSFVQHPDGYFGEQGLSLSQQPAVFQSYSSQSGEVFGILKQMKETFETNLASSQNEENENVRAYGDLKAAKDAQIGAAQSSIEMKTAELATTDEKNAQSKEDKEDTEETLAADTAFLATVKEKCAGMDAEFEERTKTRQLETQAVTKALEFLSSDEAHELFTKTFNPALLQQSSSNDRRHKVSEMLQKVAAKAHDPQLSTLAVRVRMDSFTKVKETLSKMVDNLTKEKEEDDAHKEACVQGFNKNQRATEDSNHQKKKVQAVLDDLTMTLDELTKAIESLKNEIAELHLQMKRAGENREKANRDFQLTVADQKATAKLLTASMNILKGFYEKAALLQSAKVEQPSFKPYEKNKAGSGAIFMMQSIIDDAKKLETEAIYAEGDAQKAYEEFVKESNISIEEKSKDLINKTEVKGKTEELKAEKEKNRDEILTILENLASENHDLHVSCDYILKNYDIRTAARDEEIEALKESIAMFSGASFSTFLQHLDGK